MYSRKLWFLWEWLREEQLDIEDTTKGNFVPLINSKLQYEGKSRPSRRHRVRNNLPGTRNFCPLIRKTETLEQYIGKKLSETAVKNIGQTHPDLLSRAAAFLLLKDSKSSFAIENENPPQERIQRWQAPAARISGLERKWSEPGGGNRTHRARQAAADGPARGRLSSRHSR